jgi:hypothetical protein
MRIFLHAKVISASIGGRFSHVILNDAKASTGCSQLENERPEAAK